MDRNFSIGIVIGATLSNTFNSVFNTLENKFISLQSSSQKIFKTKALANKLRSYEKSIENLEKQKKALIELGKSTEEVDRRLEIYREKLKGVKLEAVKTGISIKELRRDFKQLGTAVQEANRKLKIAKLKEDIGALRGKLTGIVGGALTVGAVIKPAIDFESAFADVKKVVDFKSPKQEKQLRETIIQMSTKIPMSAIDLAKITASGGQLGIKAEELPKFTETIAKMSVAFDMLPERAGEAFAKLKNVYRLSMEEVASLGDAINYLGNNTAAKEKDIIETLGRIGGIAKDFGLAKESAAALADAFIALGKPPEVAATAINALLGKLSTIETQSPQFRAAFQQVMPIEEFKRLKEQDPEAALLAFLDRLHDLDKEARANILSQLFGQEYSDDISLLVGSLEQYAKAIHLVSQKEKYKGAIDKEFQQRVKTTAAQLQLLSNRLNRLAINIGSVLLPPLNAVIGVIGKGIDFLAGFTQKHETLTKVVAFASVGILGLASAAVSATIALKGLKILTLSFSSGLGNLIKILSFTGKAVSTTGNLLLWTAKVSFPVARVAALSFGKALIWTTAGVFNLSKALIGKLVGALLTSSGAFSVVSKAVLFLSRVFMLNPIGFVVGGLALGAYLVIKHWGKVKRFFSGLWNYIKEGFSLLGKAIGKILELSPLGMVIKGASWIVGKVKSFFSSKEEKKKEVLKEEEKIKEKTKEEKSILESVFGKVKSIFSLGETKHKEEKVETALKENKVSTSLSSVSKKESTVTQEKQTVKKASFEETGVFSWIKNSIFRKETSEKTEKKEKEEKAEESIFSKFFSLFSFSEKKVVGETLQKYKESKDITDKSVSLKNIHIKAQNVLLQFLSREKKETSQKEEILAKGVYKKKETETKEEKGEFSTKIFSAESIFNTIKSIKTHATDIFLKSIKKTIGLFSFFDIAKRFFTLKETHSSVIKSIGTTVKKGKEEEIELKEKEKIIAIKEAIEKAHKVEKEVHFKADININLKGEITDKKTKEELLTHSIEQTLKEKFEKWFLEAMRTMQERNTRRAF